MTKAPIILFTIEEMLNFYKNINTLLQNKCYFKSRLSLGCTLKEIKEKELYLLLLNGSCPSLQERRRNSATA